MSPPLLPDDCVDVDVTSCDDDNWALELVDAPKIRLPMKRNNKKVNIPMTAPIPINGHLFFALATFQAATICAANNKTVIIRTNQIGPVTELSPILTVTSRAVRS